MVFRLAFLPLVVSVYRLNPGGSMNILKTYLFTIGSQDNRYVSANTSNERVKVSIQRKLISFNIITYYLELSSVIFRIVFLCYKYKPKIPV